MYRGASMRSVAKWEGDVLTVDSKIAQAKPATMLAKYAVAADGKSFTLESHAEDGGTRLPVQTLVFEKQPESAGADLRKPEKTAKEVEKNVTVLGSLPASQFQRCDAELQHRAGCGMHLLPRAGWFRGRMISRRRRWRAK
jgi:hypothetical protein